MLFLKNAGECLKFFFCKFYINILLFFDAYIFAKCPQTEILATLMQYRT